MNSFIVFMLKLHGESKSHTPRIITLRKYWHLDVIKLTIVHQTSWFQKLLVPIFVHLTPYALLLLQQLLLYNMLVYSSVQPSYTRHKRNVKRKKSFNKQITSFIQLCIVREKLRLPDFEQQNLTSLTAAAVRSLSPRPINSIEAEEGVGQLAARSELTLRFQKIKGFALLNQSIAFFVYLDYTVRYLSYAKEGGPKKQTYFHIKSL